MKNAHNYFQSKGETLYLLKSKQAEQYMKDAANTDYVSCYRKIGADGLFRTLVECSRPHQLGFEIETLLEIEAQQFLHGKTDYVGVISVNDDQEKDFVSFMLNHGIGITLLGHVTKGEFRVDGQSHGFVQDL
ncbi:MAG: hypothetical protein J6U70_06175 [Bacteroidales bacterium]|nr:hypothetical protein [Bacteroidales bacterium]